MKRLMMECLQRAADWVLFDRLTRGTEFQVSRDAAIALYGYTSCHHPEQSSGRPFSGKNKETV